MNNTVLIILASLALVQLGAVAWLYHKLTCAVDQLAKQTNKQNNNLFNQIEALLSLYAEMRPSHGLPATRGWVASPDFLRLLVRIVNERTPLTIVECSSGLSTLVLASCLMKFGKGKVLSLEHDPVYAEKTRLMLKQHGLENFAVVIDAPLKALVLPEWSGKWYDLTAIPMNLSIDLLVVDGPPWFSSELARYPAYPVLRNQMAPNALIILDDAARDAEKRIVARWQIETTGLTTVETEMCEKGCAVLQLE